MARFAAKPTDDDEPQDGAVGEERSIRDEILAARDEVADAQADETPTEGSADTAASDGTSSTLPTDDPADSAPGRDSSGRFARGNRLSAAGRSTGAEPSPAADGPRANSAAVANGNQPATQGAQGSQAPTGPEADGTIAPQGWSTSAKAIWQSLPELARKEIGRRETDMHRLLSRQDDERAYGRQFAEIANSNADLIQAAGVHPVRLFQDFIGVMKTLRSDNAGNKAALLRDVALRNGINLQALAGMGGNAPPNPNSQPAGVPQRGAAPPANTPLPPEFAQMASEWKEFKTGQQRLEEQRRSEAENSIVQEIEAFRSKPEARYFDAVKDSIVSLLNANAASTLEEAYDQACWMRPDIRAEMQRQQAQDSRVAEQKRLKTARARLAGGSIRGGSGSVASGAPADRSLREELQANMADARARV